jgi:protein tyrosine/serine phosphatase
MKTKLIAAVALFLFYICFINKWTQNILYDMALLAKDSFVISPLNPSLYFSDNFHTVENGKLYRSKQLTKDQLEQKIKQYDIKTIINLRPIEEDENAYNQEQEVIQKYQVKLVSAPIACAGSLPSQEKIRILLDTLNNAPKPILVHCKAGADRTGLVSALWILSIQKKSLDKALEQQAIRYNHVKRYLPYMRLFTKIWSELLEKHGDSQEALKHYTPENYLKAFSSTINELAAWRLVPKKMRSSTSSHNSYKKEIL